jgi:CheY-like chemotaxis protein
VKFTDRDGYVDVEVGRSGPQIEVSVRDSGIGIARAILPRIFERFTQADSGSTRAHAGLGLGLAIVRHIVELHGGTATAVSDGLGRGATFRLTLPVAPVQADDHLHAPPDGADPTILKPLAGIRVLFVDDEANARDMLAHLLRECGADVESVGSARDAVDAFDTQRFDIIVSDLEMPDEDGCSLIRTVRSRENLTSGRIPAVAMTAYGRAEDCARALAAGFDRHLVKPIGVDDVVATVATLARSANPPIM